MWYDLEGLQEAEVLAASPSAGILARRNQIDCSLDGCSTEDTTCEGQTD
jgi:hypothetical protein